MALGRQFFNGASDEEVQDFLRSARSIGFDRQADEVEREVNRYRR